MVSAKDGRFSVPGGTFDAWKGVNENKAPRLLLDVNDTNFEMEVTWNADLGPNDFFGVVVQTGQDQFLRFSYQGTSRLLGAFVYRDSADMFLRKGTGSVEKFKVTRVLDEYTFSTAPKGGPYKKQVVYYSSMWVKAVGVVAGRRTSAEAKTFNATASSFSFVETDAAAFNTRRQVQMTV